MTEVRYGGHKQGQSPTEWLASRKQNSCNASPLVHTVTVLRAKASKAEVTLKVDMMCEGCVAAVKRVLGKMEGVDSFDVSLAEQKVTVKGNVTADAVLEKVAKTGKKTELWPGA